MAVTNRKPKVDSADYADRLVGASVGLVTELRDEMSRMREELAEERVRSERCEGRYDALVSVLRGQGIAVPPSIPDQE